MKKITLFTLLMALLIALPGMSWGQGVFVSQNCDPKNNWAVDRFAEIYNPTDAAVDLTGWTLENVQGGAVQFTWILSGSIASGEALVCGNVDATGQTITPDFTATWVGNSWNGKGGDGTILKNAASTVVDQAVQSDATGKFENGQMVRNANITSPTSTYDATQWTFSSVDDAVDANPGEHTCDLPASVTCDVTFQVDMQYQVVSDDGVHLAGNFAPEGQPGYWDPAGNEMTDGDFDGIYEVTLTLDKSTDYEFKYINGDSWDAPDVPETVPDACATGGNRTLSVGTDDAQTLDVVCFGECVACNILDWYNLQWPGTADILSTENVTIYAQALEDGVTTVAGNENDIECWIGYSTENTDPSTWTDWVVASYNTQSGDNYEYMADLGADQSLVGTYYYASRFSYNSGDYTYGGFNAGDGGAWDGTTNVSGVLNVTAIVTIPYTQAFAADLGDCYTYSVSGATKDWYHDDSEGNPSGSAACNGWNTGDLEEDWLILPGINLDSYSNETMTFESWYKFGTDDADNYLKLQYSTDYTGLGDPSLATWSDLSYTQPSAAETWTASGNVDLSGIVGTSVWIAFKYHYNSGSYRQWNIDNISIIEGTPALEASFTASPVSPVLTGTTIDFTNTTTGGATPYASYSWQIDDGAAFETTEDASYTFNTAGTYTVKLTVTDADTDTDFAEMDITVNDPVPAPTAWINEIHYDDNSGDDDELVEIVIKNAGTITLSDVQIDLYNGNGGGSYMSETADNLTLGTTVGDYTFYAWNSPAGGIQKRSP